MVVKPPPRKNELAPSSLSRAEKSEGEKKRRGRERRRDKFSRAETNRNEYLEMIPKLIIPVERDFEIPSNMCVYVRVCVSVSFLNNDYAERNEFEEGPGK